MQTISTDTTLGKATFDVSDKATKIIWCGINYRNELQAQVFTSLDEQSGYIVYYNLKTQAKRLERIKVNYIDAKSAKRYGRKCVSETLPILKTT